MAQFDALLQPFTLKHLTLRNRVMSSAHEPSYTQQARLTERYIRYHVEKAKGGIGLTMFGGSCCVSPDSPASFGQLACMDDSIIPEFSELARRVHEHGAAIMIQLTHMGRRTRWDAGDWLPPVSPGTRREPAHRSWPKAMEEHDIRRVQQDYAEAVRRCKESGLDGLELSAAHGHLIDQFWSPAANNRSDRYGGSLENRMRFGLEVFETIRKQVGNEYIVGIRMSGDEMIDEGLSPQDCLIIAKTYAASGMVDFINVLGGSAADFRSLANCIPEMWSQVAPYLYLPSAIRNEVGIPVMHAGKIPDVATAARAVEDGHVDLVAMTRAQIADPHLVRKLMEDRVDDIRQCVGAGYCIDRIYIGKDALCIQNAATGREQNMPHMIAKAVSVRRVVVVGGGVSGLEASRVCAERGHKVILFEAQDKLGGQVNLAARAPWRESLSGIVRWLEMQVRKLGVDIRAGVAATAQAILAEQPEIVIVASGGRPRFDDWLKGSAHALSVFDILSGKVSPAANVLLYDDNGQHQGPSCAEFLANAGSRVEFVTPDRLAGEELGATNIWPHLRNLYDKDVIFSPDLRLLEIYLEGEKKVAVLRNEYTHREEERVVDQVVVEHGTLPVEDLYFALREQSVNHGQVDIQAMLAGMPQNIRANTAGQFQLFRVGDAVTSRNIHAAIFDALRLCKDL
jgi:2,4-dienoyl-CoA reductase-like NADH-dependent reductase (Old Yellow Enzyme family)